MRNTSVSRNICETRAAHMHPCAHQRLLCWWAKRASLVQAGAAAVSKGASLQLAGRYEPRTTSCDERPPPHRHNPGRQHHVEAYRITLRCIRSQSLSNKTDSDVEILPLRIDTGKANRVTRNNSTWQRRISMHEILAMPSTHWQLKKDGVVHLVHNRGHCISFWLSVPPLQVAPTFACSVASLSRCAGH